MRNWDWQFSAGVQHDLAPRLSVDVTCGRRWWGNFFITHNRQLTTAYEGPRSPPIAGSHRPRPAAALIRFNVQFDF